MSEKLTSVKWVKQRLAGQNFAPRKSLGQNFLIDENTLRKIVNQGNIGKEDLVLEIGPGMGALTEALLTEAGHVVAVEYDRGLYGLLKEYFSSATNFQLVNQDILQVDLVALLSGNPEDNRSYKVMANLPYYITTPVIFMLLETPLPWETMVFLVQKEVAQRMIAPPGSKEYGALTVMLNYFGRVELAGYVSKNVFYPAPQVDSAIVRIVPNPERQREIYPYLHQVVQAAFNQRRKTVLNALTALSGQYGGKETLQKCLEELSIDAVRRGETLSTAEYLALTRRLCGPAIISR
jgi:16S rRNA (adenine1518-N6/adenine1519-N6)-dimethyltransferase